MSFPPPRAVRRAGGNLVCRATHRQPRRGGQQPSEHGLRDDTIRSRDVRVRAIRARDIRRDSLGGEVVKRVALGPVPRAATPTGGGPDSPGPAVRCPADTIAKAGVCIESTRALPERLLWRNERMRQRRTRPPTMPQLDRFRAVRRPTRLQAEWTASVYRNPDAGPAAVRPARGRGAEPAGRCQLRPRLPRRAARLPLRRSAQQTERPWLSSRSSTTTSGRRTRT